MAFLIGMSEGLRGQKFEIKTDRTTIGRAPTNDIVINDVAASAQHCYISRRGDRYVLHDMNSTNGTCLNFDRISEAELHPKQVIQIGSSELMFDDDAPTKTPLTAAMPMRNPVKEPGPMVTASASRSASDNSQPCRTLSTIGIRISEWVNL